MGNDTVYKDFVVETLDEYIVRVEAEEQATKKGKGRITNKAGILKILRIQYECLGLPEESINEKLDIDTLTLKDVMYEVDPGNYLLYKRA